MSPDFATEAGYALSLDLVSDHALLHLGRQFDASWRADRADPSRAGADLGDETDRLSQQIFASRARPLEGLKVFARALLWAYSLGLDARIDDLPDSYELAAVEAALERLGLPLRDRDARHGPTS